MPKETIDELKERAAALEATGHALGKHIESLAAKVSDAEVERFVQQLGLTESASSKVCALLTEFVAARERKGQFSAFGLAL